MAPEENIEEEEIESEEEGDDELVVPDMADAGDTEITSGDIEKANKPVDTTTDEEKTEEGETEEIIPAVEPKPVEGETVREKALRKQVAELREQVRNKDEVIKIAQPLISDDEYNALKETYADEELERFEKLFDVIGKKKGYVKAEDVYKDKGQETLNDFLEKHPEYKPENDPEDHRWNAFFKILDKDYNRTGKTPAELQKLFEKVNRDVAEEFGESPKKTIAGSDRRAEIQKVKSVSHAGGTKTEVVKKSNAPTDPNVRKMFKGFSDDDF